MEKDLRHNFREPDTVHPDYSAFCGRLARCSRRFPHHGTSSEFEGTPYPKTLPYRLFITSMGSIAVCITGVLVVQKMSPVWSREVCPSSPILFCNYQLPGVNERCKAEIGYDGFNGSGPDLDHGLLFLLLHPDCGASRTSSDCHRVSQRRPSANTPPVCGVSSPYVRHARTKILVDAPPTGLCPARVTRVGCIASGSEKARPELLANLQKQKSITYIINPHVQRLVAARALPVNGNHDSSNEYKYSSLPAMNQPRAQVREQSLL